MDSEEVKLRPLEQGDLDLLVRWRNDSLDWFFTSDLLSYSEQERWYAQYLANPLERMYIIDQCAIYSDGVKHAKPVGSLALVKISYLHRRAEVGRVVVDKDELEKGYATQAVKQLVKIAFTGLNLRRLYVEVLTDNAAAIRLYERCGFEQEGVLRRHIWKNGFYQNVTILGLFKEPE